MNLRAAAAIVKARSHGKCEVCGLPGVQAHHRTPRGMGGVSRAGADWVNRPAALLWVCLACHSWIEHNRTAAGELGHLVRRPADPATIPILLDATAGSGWWLLGDDGGYEPVRAKQPETFVPEPLWGTPPTLYTDTVHQITTSPVEGS